MQQGPGNSQDRSSKAGNCTDSSKGSHSHGASDKMRRQKPKHRAKWYSRGHKIQDRILPKTTSFQQECKGKVYGAQILKMDIMIMFLTVQYDINDKIIR